VNVKIYTDGSANNRDDRDGRPGGWGVVLLTDTGHRKELSGVIQHPEARPTNNDMELQAVTEGLRAIKRPEIVESVTVYTDSQVTIARAHKKAWRTPDPVFLMDAMHEQIRRIRRECPLRFEHVPGHAGVTENERAHQLAFEEYAKAKAAMHEVTKLEKHRAHMEVLAERAQAILKTMDPKVWGEQAIENVKKFQVEEARFYHLITYDLDPSIPTKVKVGGKDAWLTSVVGGKASIVFKHLITKNARKKTGHDYPEVTFVDYKEVVPNA